MRLRPAFLALALLLASGCGEDVPLITDVVDGAWRFVLSGDCITDADANMTADEQSVDVTDGLFGGTLTLGEAVASACTTAETAELMGVTLVPHGEPAAAPDYAYVSAWFWSSVGRVNLSGTLSSSGGSGVWSATSGLHSGTFTLLPPP